MDMDVSRKESENSQSDVEQPGHVPLRLPKLCGRNEAQERISMLTLLNADRIDAIKVFERWESELFNGPSCFSTCADDMINHLKTLLVKGTSTPIPLAPQKRPAPLSTSSPSTPSPCLPMPAIKKYKARASRGR